MLDTYLYEDVPVLRNLFGIKNADDLEHAEDAITSICLLNVDGILQGAAFDLERLLAIHRHIFCHIFKQLGITMSDAINMFPHQVANLDSVKNSRYTKL